MFKNNKKSAFTLAEIMIVFTVIGVLTAILVPALFTASPDQEKLRAKKAFNTLTRAVESLTNSGPYDTNGGILTSTSYATDADDRNAFFCNNLAEILNVKSVDCSHDDVNGAITSTTGCATFVDDTTTRNRLCLEKTDDVADYEKLQNSFDSACEAAFYQDDAPKGDFNIVTSDGIMWGIQRTDFNNPQTITVNSVTSPAFYNLICIDVDNHNDAQFIYGAGVRKDGKILVGTKLQEIVTEDYEKVMNEE